MPEGAVYVGRPSVWGNPFPEPTFGLDRSLRLFRNSVQGIWSPSVFAENDPDHIVGFAYKEHLRWTRRLGGHPLEVIRSELAGRDLACWCPLNQPCHADVLLEFANGSAR